jgi:hypothetical protein
LTLVSARAIGVMTMVDSGKRDHKVLAVALKDPEYCGFTEASELPPHRLTMLRRFFQDYKTLENKAVEVEEMAPHAAALPVIERRSSATARCGDMDSRNEDARQVESRSQANQAARQEDPRRPREALSRCALRPASQQCA